MLNISIICVGKIKEAYLKDAINEYSKRLSKYCNLNIVELPDEKLPDKINSSIIEIIKKKESTKIIDSLKKDSYVIALDLNGKSISSEDFSKKIDNISLNYNSNISFIIGGTLGLTNDVIDCSSESICFSKMTFPHQLIRLFLLEQLFRGFKISKGETYHW
ncbi:MAG: 23S rRNA (pseudouridine(1915)-N(3))-methyltransferase RlmH [Lachnospiraceae bacterium]|jgi:23S rRNA (pseudouridine1915-N3)-methyltransferase|nr:23S rRNA (pseudouridine(1915)-N(3))-methyltransferase RlmH [Lachnospiraceae bacterium]